jgi:Autographiviridae endonuclease I
VRKGKISKDFTKKNPKPFTWKRSPVRSGLEARVIEDLENRKIKYEYETLDLPYVKKYCPSCGEPIQKGIYKPDFIIGSIIVEAKGRFTAADRKKHISVRELNPDADIRILFQRDQKLGKNSKTKYSEWCEGKGITYAIGEQVPEQWIRDSRKTKR